MTDGYCLDRFVRAQAGIYPAALAELQAGLKRTHWMWFIFPQIHGLGLSEKSRLYAISGRVEAEAYLDHELLGPRLEECTRAMLAHAGERTPLQILGPIDTLKFKSSMTLFDAVCGDGCVYGQALDQLCDGLRDAATLAKLAES